MSRDANKVCVRGLPPGVSEDDLKDFFSRCGEINDCFIGASGQFAFIGFPAQDGFEQALKRDGEKLKDTAVSVQPKMARGERGERPQRVEFKVHVQFADGTSADELRSLFERAGNINDFHIPDGRSFAFIGFDNEADLAAALKFDGREVNGRPLVVQRKRARPPPPGREVERDREDRTRQRSPPRRERSDSRDRRHGGEKGRRHSSRSRSRSNRRRDSRSPKKSRR